MEKVYFKTFGCRTNKFDTQVMISSLKRYEPTQDLASASVVVVNSCTVTNGADSGVRNFISKVRREYPDKKILFTGCGFKTRARGLLERGEIHGAFSVGLKTDIDALLGEKRGFLKEGQTGQKELILRGFSSKRAFIKIQEGCNFDCSYCIIPAVRGRARSLAAPEILAQISALCERGFSEFILTGTNTGSYGVDCGEDLAGLIKKITAIDGVRRIRLGSIEPSQVSGALIDALEQKGDRYLHVAIQHTHEQILKRMRRRNKYESDLALFKRLRSYGFALGTDFIVGFPGESEAVWQEAFARLEVMPLTHVHSFIYSRRDETLAAGFKDAVRGDDAKERQRALIDLVASKNYEFRKGLSSLCVLIESSEQAGGADLSAGTGDLSAAGEFVSQGTCEYFNKIEIHSKRPLSGWVSLERLEHRADKTLAYV
ncbi:MAG: MiaB/RimO family radical SAM methylthiotransferase [Helicobacteraceae bacterium]